MFGLNFLGGLLLLPILGNMDRASTLDPAEAAAAIGGGRLVFGALISIATFAVGGFIVGLKSPGRTIVEPGLSAAMAVIIGLIISGALRFGTLLAAGLMPFLAGVLGGYLGERRQGSTTGPGRSLL